jgi:hypothetical protein
VVTIGPCSLRAPGRGRAMRVVGHWFLSSHSVDEMLSRFVGDKSLGCPETGASQLPAQQNWSGQPATLRRDDDRILFIAGCQLADCTTAVRAAYGERVGGFRLGEIGRSA